MATYSFKSVGKTKEQQLVETLIKSEIPIGIKTPLRPGTKEGIFAMHYNLSDQVHDNLRNLILTNWGERICFYDFGANLRPILTDLASPDDFDSQAIERISGAVQRWMPYVILQEFSSQINHVENKNTAIIQLTITYDIPTLGVQSRALQVKLYAI